MKASPIEYALFVVILFFFFAIDYLVDLSQITYRSRDNIDLPEKSKENERV